LAAMEIEKVTRSLVHAGDLERVRAILLLLSDDYVRSTNEDARKGGVVALAACAIGMKKVNTTTAAATTANNNNNNSSATASSTPNSTSNSSKDDSSQDTNNNNNNNKDDNSSGNKEDANSSSNNNNNNNMDTAATDASLVQECRDLILASTVHACQDHSQRVRYYACENLCNVVKVIPALAIRHFFILFEILRSLYADVSVEVRRGAELLDRKMKEIVVHAMNSGTLTAAACMPVFARFVYIRHKPTKRLTLTWLQELTEKLIGSPILEYLHLVLGGIFDMIGDPTVAIRQSALAFLQSVLPKLLTLDNDTPMEEDETGGAAVNFDKILQALVTTMEHPDPFVRKVAMYWMSRIVKAHIGEGSSADASKKTNNKGSSVNRGGRSPDEEGTAAEESERIEEQEKDAQEANNTTIDSAVVSSNHQASAASISVRNSVPHVLPGILLSIGDTYNQAGSGGGNNKNSFLPDLTTRALAEQTNACLQDAVRRGGSSYIPHLDGFIVALREELDSPGGLPGKNAPAIERTPYRMDVNHDGTGIESSGWFRGNESLNEMMKDRSDGGDDAMVMSRLCALHWVIVLYKYVVPDLLKADYAREFIFAIINQLVDDPPKIIVYKSLEVLAKITVPVEGEESSIGKRGATSASLSSKFVSPSWASSVGATSGGNLLVGGIDDSPQIPMTETSIEYALDILGADGRHRISRDREVFWALIQMHAANQELIVDLDRVIAYMCKLQPSEFVMVSFSVELDRFIRKRHAELRHQRQKAESMGGSIEYAQELAFVSSFVQHMNHVLLTCEEARSVRELLKNCVGENGNSEHDRQRCRIFHILLHSFAHNLGSVVSLCLWSGAFRTASIFLEDINPLDINIGFLLEIDRLVDMLERPLFRHIDILMLENDADTNSEGSGSMLFRALKSVLMILPQSTCYRVLRDRLNSIARFRQSTNMPSASKLSFRQQAGSRASVAGKTELYVNRVLQTRAMHCETVWLSIRAESFETPMPPQDENDRLPNGGGNMLETSINIGDVTKFETPGKPPRIVDLGSKQEERWKMYWTASAQ